jgi:hypothetical protein
VAPVRLFTSHGGNRHINASNDCQLVAIFGAGRNGSTLLGRLLDGSAELWAHPPEVNYLSMWDDLAHRGRPAADTLYNATTRQLKHLGASIPTRALLSEYAGQWSEIEDTYVARLSEPVERKLDPADLLNEQTEWTVAHFLPAFLEATRRAYDTTAAPRRAMLFKTIETPYVEDYLQVFGGLRAIHIVRDPLGNFASAKRTWSLHKNFTFYHGGHDQLRTFLDARWLPHARTMAKLTAEDPEHHRIVRYEDVASDPVREVREICAWLEIEPPEHPSRLTVLGGREFAQMPSNPSQPGIAPPSHVVANMEDEYSYTQLMTARERDLIAFATGPLGERVGYPPRQLPGPFSRFRLWLRWLPVDSSERLHVRSRLRFLSALLRRRLYITRVLLRGRARAL